MMAVLSSLLSLLMLRMMPYFRSSLASYSSHSQRLVPSAFEVIDLHPEVRHSVTSAARHVWRDMQTETCAVSLMARLELRAGH